MIPDLLFKIINFFQNLFIFIINFGGSLWNFVYKLFTPKKKRKFSRLYKKKAYVRWFPRMVRMDSNQRW